MKTINANAVYFGGDDLPRGRLRDLLEERIDQVPQGGCIDWVTYYFRDRRLAAALLRARDRGVKVTLTLAGKPRMATANAAVIEMLDGTGGLDGGIRVLAQTGVPAPRGRAWKPQLHMKLYCFSHPTPIAFVGSFNPSGDEPENDPELIAEIGDQDAGHNVLVGLQEPALVEELVARARHVHRSGAGLMDRFSARNNLSVNTKETALHFWPRISSHPVMDLLRGLGHDARVRVAASHLRCLQATRLMIELAKRCRQVSIIAERSLRRVPIRTERRLVAAGVAFKRLQCRHEAPMHLKFVLVETGHFSCSIFGSFNWTYPSFWLNHEIAVVSRCEKIHRAFEWRWQVLEERSR